LTRRQFGVALPVLLNPPHIAEFLSEEHMNGRFQHCIERLDDRTTLRTDDATWPNLADHHVIETRALSPAAAAM